jgi:hypothetical protein
MIRNPQGLKNRSTVGALFVVRLTLATLTFIVPTSAAPAELPEPVVISASDLAHPGANEKNRVRALAFSPDGHLLVTAAGGAAGLCFWDGDTLRRLSAVEVPRKGSMRAIAFSADGGRMFTFGDAVTCWDPAAHKVLSQWHVNGQSFSFALSPDGRTVAIGRYTDRDQRKGLLELRQSSSGAMIRQVEGRGDTIRSLAFSSDGRLVAGAVQQEFSEAIHAVRVWDVASGRQVNEFDIKRGRAVDAIAFDAGAPVHGFGLSTFPVDAGSLNVIGGPSPFDVSPAAGRAIVRGECGPALCDLHSGRMLGTLDTSANDDASWPFAISADGRTMAAAAPTGALVVWTTDRARAKAAGRLPDLSCEMLVDRSQYLTGEAIGWRCRLTNVSDKPLPVYAWANAPQRSAIRLRMTEAAGGNMRPERTREVAQASPAANPAIPPTLLAPGESMELRFNPVGPDAIAAGGGNVISLGADAASLDIARVEYAPTPPDGPDARGTGAGVKGDTGASARRVTSQPLAIARDPGPAFSRGVYSDWIKSSDGAVSVRIHTDSALYGRNAGIFIHGEVRNNSGHPLTCRVPQDDLYAGLHIIGPRGPVPSRERPTRRPRYITLEPGGIAAVFGPLGPEHFDGIDLLGEYSIAFEYRSASARADAPANLWQGSVTTPPIRVWRVPSLAAAPPEALRPTQEASAASEGR